MGLVRIRVLFFGMLKDVVQRGTEDLDLPESSVLSDVLAHYVQIIPSLKLLMPSVAISINQEYAEPETRLKEGDEVALLPPAQYRERSGAPECLPHSMKPAEPRHK